MYVRVPRTGEKLDLDPRPARDLRRRLGSAGGGCRRWSAADMGVGWWYKWRWLAVDGRWWAAQTGRSTAQMALDVSGARHCRGEERQWRRNRKAVPNTVRTSDSRDNQALSNLPASHLFRYRSCQSTKGTKEMVQPLSDLPACHLFRCRSCGTKEMVQPLSDLPAWSSLD